MLSIPVFVGAQGILLDSLGHFDTPGTANAVFVRGNYAYVVTRDPDSLFIIDISDQTNPLRAGGAGLLGNGYDVYVQGDYAYTGTGSNDLVYDISDPSNPFRVGQHSSFVIDGLGIIVSGTLAYVAHGEFFVTGAAEEGKFRIYNVSDPAIPVELSGIPDFENFMHDVFVIGDVTAYVAEDSFGLQIFDVVDPNNPFQLGVYDTPGRALGVYVVDSVAYVADELSGLRIINVSDPAAPVEIGSFDTPGTAKDVFVQRDLVYLADGVAGLKVFDVRVPANPVEVGSHNTPGDARDVFVANDLIYVADGSPGLFIYRLRTATVSFPASPTSIIALETTNLTGLDVGSVQFVLSYPDSLIDSTEAFSDTTLGGADWELQWNAVPGTLSVASAGSAILSGTGPIVGLIFHRAQGVLPGVQAPVRFESFMFNEGDPLAFTKDGMVILRFGYGDVSEDGQVSAFDSRLIFESLIGRIGLSAVQQKKAEVSGDSSISTLDASLILQFVVGLIDSFPIEFPTPPILIASGELSLPDRIEPAAEQVVIPIMLRNGEMVYSGSFEMNYNTNDLDFSDVLTTGATDGFLIDHLVSDGHIELLLAGASKLEGDQRIVEVIFTRKQGGSSQTEVTLNSARLNENLDWAIGDTTIIDFTTGVDEEIAIPAEYVLFQNHPNPFNPVTKIDYALPKSGDVLLTIYNILGEEVTRLVEGEMPAGIHTMTWDASGYSSGIYFYRLQTENFIQTKKMLLLK